MQQGDDFGGQEGKMLMDNACLDLLAGLRMTLVCKEDKVRGCICMYVVIGRLKFIS